MAIRIFAGGSRSATDTGQVEDWYGNEGPEQNECDQELARTFSDQWVKLRDRLPSETLAVLCLAANSDGLPSGTVRYGHYSRRRKAFIEQGGGEAIPHDLVIAWMRIPKVPADIQEELRRKQAYAYLD